MAAPLPERRAFVRYDTNVSAILTSPTLRIGSRMLSVSAGGALLRLDRLSAKVFDADTFLIEIVGIGRFSASKKWRRDTDIGAKFELSDSDRLRLAERLAERFGRRKSPMPRISASSPQP